MIVLGITITESPPIKGMARAHNRSMKSAHEALGEYDRTHFLPMRFQGGPYHQQRKPGYLKNKRKMGKPATPLVFTGLAKSIALQHHRIRAYPTRVTYTIPGPFYFTMRRKDASRPYLVGEVLWRAPGMLKTHERIAGQRYEEAMRAEKEKKVTKITA